MLSNTVSLIVAAIQQFNIGLLIKSLDADVYALEVEIGRLTERKRIRANRRARLYQYLQENLPEDTKWDFTRVSIRFQLNPPSVAVTDEGEVESRFLRIIPQSYEVDKKAIKDYWKETGKVPPGVTIVDDVKRLVVK